MLLWEKHKVDQNRKTDERETKLPSEQPPQRTRPPLPWGHGFCRGLPLHPSACTWRLSPEGRSRPSTPPTRSPWGRLCERRRERTRTSPLWVCSTGTPPARMSAVERCSFPAGESPRPTAFFFLQNQIIMSSHALLLPAAHRGRVLTVFLFRICPPFLLNWSTKNLNFSGCYIPFTENLNFSGFMDLKSCKRVLWDSSISHVLMAFCTVSSSDPFGHSWRHPTFLQIRQSSSGSHLSSDHAHSFYRVLRLTVDLERAN